MVSIGQDDVLRRAAVPEDDLFSDSFNEFVDARANMLVELARARLAYDDPSDSERQLKAEREARVERAVLHSRV